jgi:hypothetical protein
MGRLTALKEGSCRCKRIIAQADYKKQYFFNNANIRISALGQNKT